MNTWFQIYQQCVCISGMWFCFSQLRIWDPRRECNRDSKELTLRTSRHGCSADTVDGRSEDTANGHRRTARYKRSEDTKKRRSEDSQAWKPGGDVVSPSNSGAKGRCSPLSWELQGPPTREGGVCAPREWLVLLRREREEGKNKETKHYEVQYLTADQTSRRKMDATA